MTPHGCLFPHVSHDGIPRGAAVGSGAVVPSPPVGVERPQSSAVSLRPYPKRLAYVAAQWMPVGSFGREAVPETRPLIDAILLSGWAVLGLLCFLHAARDGLPFFTRCPDPRLASRNGNEPGERGSLFRLSPGLLQRIRTVGVAAILEGTTFDPAGAEAILDFSERLDWLSCTGVVAMTPGQSTRVRNAVCTGDHSVVAGNGSGRGKRM